MAATTRSAATGIEILCVGDAPKLESFRDVLADGFLHLVHRLLCIEKTARDRIAEERCAQGFVFVDLRAIQRETLLLFVLKVFALGSEFLVLRLGFLIAREALDRAASILEFRLVENGLAKFPRFFGDRILFDDDFHNYGAVSRAYPACDAN